LEEFAKVEIEQEQSIICIVGNLPKDKAGYGFQSIRVFKRYTFTNGVLWRKFQQH
jgi:hypothetical protein